MATADESALPVAAVAAVLERYGLSRVHLAVAGAAALGLAARLFELGARVAHWDEARVAYWTLRFAETGNYEYDAIIHGPFYHHVNRGVFALLGPSDFSMRLAVAVLGGLFPLVALCFRDRLRDAEVVALAGLLAFNPVLLYYTRFMRGDPLVAMFAFAGFAFAVRAADTGRRRYVHACVLAVALAFTAKENVLVTLLTWAGALALLLDHRLVTAAEGDEGPRAVLYDRLRHGAARLRRRWRTAALAVVEFLAVVVFFYAPRARTEPGPGLWKALAGPEAFVSTFPAVVSEATVGAWQELWGTWVAGGHRGHAYLPYLTSYLETLAYAALVVGLFAVAGFLADRYRADGPRDSVAFAAYWGFVSVLGYPVITDIDAPWATVHAVVPLAVPAAVGLGLVVRWARGAAADRAPLPAALAVFVCLLVVVQVASTGVVAVYQDEQADENRLTHFSQPADDFSVAMDRLDAAAPGHPGVDVVVYSDYFVRHASASGRREPGCARWFNLLPLPWYFEASDARATCATNETGLARAVESDRPPLVVGRIEDQGTLVRTLDGYESRRYRIRSRGQYTLFFVRDDLAGALSRRDDDI